jgi:hypothetical protein
MDGWVHIGRLQGFAKQVEIKAEIVCCLSAIDDCMTKFQVFNCFRLAAAPELSV